MLKQDLLFQWRHGFYPIYAAVTALYVIILFFLPSGARPMAAMFMVFSDTAVLGFFFIGGIILLERSEQLLESLFITPLTIREYIVSKVVSLSLLSLLCSLVILLPAGLPSPASLLPVLLGVLVSSILFILIGMIIAVEVPDINHYFLWSLGFIIFAVPAVLEFLGLFRSRWIYLIPFRGILEIIRAGLEGERAGVFVLLFGTLIPWLVVAFFAAGETLRKAVEKRGGQRSWIKF